MNNMSKLLFSMLLLMSGSSIINAFDVEATQRLQSIINTYHADGWYGKGKLISEPIEQGANPNLVGYHNITPLHAAVEAQDSNTVKALIKAGADIEATDQNYSTPLRLAISRNDLDIAKYLLEQGADPNNHRPLLLAIMQGKPNMVRILLEAGADIDVIKSVTKMTALELARSQARTYSNIPTAMEVIKVLEEYSKTKKQL
jgi:ankyrin repeat protein